MDGEDAGCVFKFGVMRVLRSQKNRHERCVPVVDVKDIGTSEESGRFDGGAAEHIETLVAVPVITVNGVTVEVPIMFNEIMLYTVLFAAIEHGTETVAER